MSDETHITRRASLRGIAATGAIIGSTGLTASTVSASEKKVDAVKDVYFKGCHAVAVHLEDDHDEIPIRIRVYNDETNRFENIERTITDEHLLPYPIWEQLPDDYDEKDDHDKKNDDEDDHEDDETDKKKDRKKKGDHEDDEPDKKKGDHEDDEPDKKKDELPEWICEDDVEPPKGHKPDDDDGKRVWVFNIHQFYDHGVDTDNEIISVDIGDKRIENPNCDEKHRPEYDKKGDIDVDDIGLVAICFDAKRNTARFRVDNDNKKSVTVEYDVYNTDQDGEVTVEPQSTTYFDVEATGSEGQATVRLFYDDDQIDVKASNTQRECADDVTVYSSALDLVDERVQFTVSDNAEYDRMLSYYVAETGETGTITVPGDGVSLASFWVHAPYGHASVTLYHHGIVVGKAERKPDLSGPVVNVDQGESYETIQAAVDDADEGDTIVVCGPETFEENVRVTESIHLVGVDDPVVQNQPTPQFQDSEPAILIDADNVRISGIDFEEGIDLNNNQDVVELGDGVSGTVLKDLDVRSPGFTGTPGEPAIGIENAGQPDAFIGDLTISNVHADRAIGLLVEDATVRIKEFSAVKPDGGESLFITGPGFSDADTLELEIEDFEPVDNDNGTGSDTDILIFGQPASVNGESGSPSEQADAIFDENSAVETVEIDGQTFDR